MNWQVNRVFVALSLAALLIGGCERENLTIGYPSGTDILNQEYIEYIPDSYMVQLDSIATDFSPLMLAGYLDDPNFGEFMAIPHIEIFQGNEWDTDVTQEDNLDSARWRIIFSYHHGVNYTPTLNFDILMLDPWENKANFYSFEELPGDSLVDNITIPIDGTVDYSFSDTVDIDMGSEFAQAFFAELQAGKGDTLRSSGVSNLVPGFKFIPNTSTEGVIGFLPTQSNFTLYWSGPEDTVATVAQFNLTNNRHTYIEPNEYTQNRPGTALENLVNTYERYDAANNNLYYQSATGVNIVLDMQDLYDLDTLQDVVITNAILEITDIVNPFNRNTPPPSLELRLLDENNRNVFTHRGIRRKVYNGLRSDSLSSSGIRSAAQTPIILEYDISANKYQADITPFLESFRDGSADLTKLLLYHDSPVTANDDNTNRADQLIVDKSNVRLRIFYTQRVKN